MGTRANNGSGFRAGVGAKFGAGAIVFGSLGGVLMSPILNEEVEEKDNQEAKAEDYEGAAYNPVTGEINWDCPCLGGMAHGPCGEEFKEAFACFVYSETEPKGIDCIKKFEAMRTCFRRYPEHYKEHLEEDERDVELEGAVESERVEPTEPTEPQSAPQSAPESAPQSAPVLETPEVHTEKPVVIEDITPVVVEPPVEVEAETVSEPKQKAPEPKL